MESVVTVVLPVHNAERWLRSALIRILELTEPAARRLQLAVVDDGSTDETFETACELSRLFPQIRVFRQPIQCGFSAALDEVRRRLNVRQAIVHDGVGRIDADELLGLLRAPRAEELPPAVGREFDSATNSCGSRRFGSATALAALRVGRARSGGVVSLAAIRRSRHVAARPNGRKL